LKKLIESKALRQQYGENGRAMVVANFSQEKIHDETLNTYMRGE
jgi:glycosyltransferase involved in cell wall biosynthesis